MEATLEQKVQQNETPGDMKFSWRSVYRRWIQNMKDDIDPALNGAKIGVYSIHGWSTLYREHTEGKLKGANEKVSGITSLVTFAAQAGAYYAGIGLVNDAAGSVTVRGATVGVGYGLLSLPLAANAVCWSKEAFRKAKKSEMERIVMTRMHRSIEQPNQEYHLSCTQLRDELAKQYCTVSTQKRDAAKEKFENELNNIVQRNPHRRMDGLSVEKKMEYLASTDRYALNDLRPMYEASTITDEQLLSGAQSQARLAMGALAKDVFDGLFAEGYLGKPYETTSTLHTGSSTRKFQNGIIPEGDANTLGDLAQQAVAVIAKAVHEHGGTAKVELLGTVTAVYNPSDAKGISYQVTPNDLWKV